MKRGPKEKSVQHVPIMSANCAGCYNKVQSLVDNVNHIGAGIITLQETHFTQKGRLNSKFCDFEIFEAIRKKQKGGTLVAAHKSLDPILIEEYSEDFELIVMEVKIGGRDIRIVSGYGPQENWTVAERMPFFKALEEEIIKAASNEKAIYIQMDTNSKLGPTIIKGDPHVQSENGKLLAGIIDRNALHVINNSKECIGRITRKRITKKKKEESIIDFVLACEDMAEMIEELVIDEDKQHVLTSFRKTKTGTKNKESDHNTLITKVTAVWNKKLHAKRIEMYNLKDKEGLKKFKAMTSQDTFLSSKFKDGGNIERQSKIFLKRLGYCVKTCFNKIRVKRTKSNKEVEDLFHKRRILKTKTDEASFEELQLVENMLANKCAEDNATLIKDACEGLTCEGGGVNAGKLWRLKKQLRGILQEPPTAMLDDKGNLITTSAAMDKLVLDMYRDRLQSHQIKESLKMHEVQREELWAKRLEEAQQNKTPEWTLEDPEIVLQQLKNNKSRDPLGFANEVFKPENSGTDLKLALLKMSNNMKDQQVFPQALAMCNISSLCKNKGSRKDFGNYRGIFRVTVIRSILDKLIYNDEYQTIDANLTDSNVGARRNRNIRDNIFVINAISNNTVKRNLKDRDVQIVDVEKCFDKLWSSECYNDIYENGFKNTKLSLLYQINKNAQVVVKTSTGITPRMSISKTIMQGTVWGSLLCTSTVDGLGKQCYETPEILYHYKGVPIPPLGRPNRVASSRLCIR